MSLNPAQIWQASATSAVNVPTLSRARGTRPPPHRVTFPCFTWRDHTCRRNRVRAEPFAAASPVSPWPLTSSYRAAQWKVMKRVVGFFREPVVAGAALWLADSARHVRAVQYVLSTRRGQKSLWQNVKESQTASFSWVFWWNSGSIC